MGGEPKQLRLLDGRPILCWSARALLDSLSGPLVVVLPEERIEAGERALRAHLSGGEGRTRIVVGGERRQDSVRAGLTGLEGVETVLVHDAARPFASPALVERVGRRAAGGRVVVPGLPVRETLKEVAGDRVVGTLDRDRIVAVQTPQGFPLPVLREAHEAARGDVTAARDDASLCERRGVPVSWIQGEELNRKLTVPEDWRWAEIVVESGGVRWR